MIFEYEVSLVVRFKVDLDGPEAAEIYKGALEGYDTGVKGYIPDEFQIQTQTVYDFWHVTEGEN